MQTRTTWQIAELYYRKTRTQKERDVEWIKVNYLIKKLKKSCYCKGMEGTFISDIDSSEERCIYCDIIKHLAHKVIKGEEKWKLKQLKK